MFRTKFFSSVKVALCGALAMTCVSCAHCPWMAMNGLQGVLDCLEQGVGEITVPEDIRVKAHGCIDRMLDFVAKTVTVSGDVTEKDGVK